MTKILTGSTIEPLLNTVEVAAILGISPASIYKRRCLGESLPRAVRIGNSLRFRPADVEAFCEEQLEKI